MLKDNPLLDKIWTKKNPCYIERKYEKEHILRLKYIFGNNISGNIVEFGGGSGSVSIMLSKVAKKLTIVDYSPQMIKELKKTLKLNKIHMKNITIVNEKMENYKENLKDADYIIFTFSMSFSNINKTIKNITDNSKIGCKIIIAETLKPIIFDMRTDLNKEHKINNTKWKNNLLKIEKSFNKNLSWKLLKKDIKGNRIPNLILHYTKIK